MKSKEGLWSLEYSSLQDFYRIKSNDDSICLAVGNKGNAKLIAMVPELQQAVKHIGEWHEAIGKGSLKGIKTIIEQHVIPVYMKTKELK